MRKFITMIAAAVVTLGVVSASAQDLLTNVAATVANTTIIQDQSKLPDQDNREGYAIRVYNFAAHGGAVGTIDLGEALPDNVLVRDGYVQVITPIAPATSTGAISLVTSGDLIADGVTLQTAGMYDIVPNVWSVSYDTTNVVQDGATATNAVVTAVSISQAADILTSTATNKVSFDISGSAATQGVFFVYLDLLRVQ